MAVHCIVILISISACVFAAGLDFKFKFKSHLPLIQFALFTLFGGQSARPSVKFSVTVRVIIAPMADM